MKRKTSLSPTRVYKFYLRPPTGETATLVDQLFANYRIHYNKLITIERVRRGKFRLLRTSMFPRLSELEKKYAESRGVCDLIVKSINESKVKSQSRQVDPLLKEALKDANEARKAVNSQLKIARAEANSDFQLKERAKILDEEANHAIKALRKETYWGTYLLAEAAAEQAESDSLGDPEYNDDPPYRLKSRLGVHFNGGIGVDELTTNTLMRIHPLNREAKPNRPIGAKRREREKLLRFRVGSTEKKEAIWAEFAMQMHRPLPADARIKDAFITRRSNNVTMPWKYSLCIVLESKEFYPLPGESRLTAETAINFGWRSIDGELRLAYLKGDHGEREVRLPQHLLGRLAKSEELRGLCDEKFNVAKLVLAAWLKDHECPEGFREAFRHIGKSQSQHEVMELVWYWKTRRFEGDAEIFAVMDEWRERYRHLMKWAQDELSYFQRCRDNFYRQEAKRIATESARVVIDSFDMAERAKKKPAGVESDRVQEAEHNRVMASPSDLRSKILHACAKYGCEVVIATAKDSTQRCQKCGKSQQKPVKALVRRCIECDAVWDQDSNNTVNLNKASASGEVVSLVVSNSPPENQQDNGGGVKTLGGARKHFEKLLKTT
jgi:hypothetical protein